MTTIRITSRPPTPRGCRAAPSRDGRLMALVPALFVVGLAAEALIAWWLG